MSDTELNTVFDILGSARSVRKYEDRPIDRAVLTKIVQAGTFASNPRNTQPWKFIVVDNPVTKENLASFIEPRALEVEKVIPKLETEKQKRLYESAANLIREFAKSPAIIFICGIDTNYGKDFDSREMILSATYAAAQNILVAARASGLGAAFTTLHLHAKKEFESELGLPSDTHIEVTIPIGYPLRPFGPVSRKQIEDVMFWNKHKQDI
jgi:nitroreductase